MKLKRNRPQNRGYFGIGKYLLGKALFSVKKQEKSFYLVKTLFLKY